MSLSLTNRDDIIANSYSLITENGAVVDLLDVIGGSPSDATVAVITTLVDNKISNLVGAAPAALNTLVELSTALNNDANYATTITNSLAVKAPLASPAFTGTATAAALTVNGALLVGATNVLTELGLKATTANLNLKAPLASPALTGEATAVNLTVSGALLAGATNVLTELG